MFQGWFATFSNSKSPYFIHEPCTFGLPNRAARQGFFCRFFKSTDRLILFGETLVFLIGAVCWFFESAAQGFLMRAPKVFWKAQVHVVTSSKSHAGMLGIKRVLKIDDDFPTVPFTDDRTIYLSNKSHNESLFNCVLLTQTEGHIVSSAASASSITSLSVFRGPSTTPLPIFFWVELRLQGLLKANATES